MKMISWNMQQKRSSWRYLLDLDIDLALLQETCKPPPDVAERIEAASAIEVDPVPWPPTAGNWPKYRTAIVKLSNRIEVEWIEATSIDMVTTRELGVSVPGLLSAARVTPPSGAPIIVMSMYAHWVTSHTLAGSKFILSDGSAHRVVSDLSAFVAAPDGHRILAAGDLNILRGYGEYGDRYWAARYQTVFDRMEVIGMPCIGPEYPNGRQADPWPDELPRDSKNVPTYRSVKQTVETASRQLDYVFASRELADLLRVRALNDPEEWGPSDHCRIEIEYVEAA